MRRRHRSNPAAGVGVAQVAAEADGLTAAAVRLNATVTLIGHRLRVARRLVDTSPLPKISKPTRNNRPHAI